jgi:hypothetical protein
MLPLQPRAACLASCEAPATTAATGFGVVSAFRERSRTPTCLTADLAQRGWPARPVDVRSARVGRVRWLTAHPASDAQRRTPGSSGAAIVVRTASSRTQVAQDASPAPRVKRDEAGLALHAAVERIRSLQAIAPTPRFRTKLRARRRQAYAATLA